MINKIKIIVQDIGEMLLVWQKEGILEGHWEGTQFKARVDLMAHNELESRLKKLDSNIPVLSEENLDSLCVNRPQLYWLIDPIDGTASFVQGFNGFVTQIALIEQQKPVISAIYAPALKSLYWAQRGEGAFCNENRLIIQTDIKLRTLIDNYPEPRGIARQVYDAFSFQYYVECGSISLKICKIADRSADLFIKNVQVCDWDFAAPQLVLEEAGGFLCYLDGDKPVYKGSYAHNGLIVCQSAENARKIVEWYR